MSTGEGPGGAEEQPSNRLPEAFLSRSAPVRHPVRARPAAGPLF
ncbi:hypothetical protein [Paenibacillus sp. GbtcB18]|nr:hypothetical protein [Paenibacillus sp. GbtcB18]